MDLNNIDFTFMKTGSGDNNFSISDDEKIDIYSLILTFMENAIKTAGIYVEHCGRTVIQTMDIKLGLQQEVFMFLKRDNIKTLEKNRKEIVKDYYKMENEEDDIEYTDNLIEEDYKEESHNMFEFNTPHSWSNASGYGNIQVNTSDNKNSTNPWNRLHKLE